MKSLWKVAVLGVGVLMSMSACLTDDDGGGGGGGGPVVFNKGFVFVRGDDVYVVDQSDYTKLGRLTSTGNNKQPALSADGKSVVFVHVDPVAGNSIQTVTTSGSGTPRTVYTADAVQKNFRTPAFSPDGMKIVFAYDKGAGSNSFLGVVNADGSGFRELTSGTLSYAAPCFYKDGTSVLAVAGSSTSYTQLQKVNVTTGTPSTVATSLDPAVASITNRAVLSPDETQVAFDGRLASNTSVSRIFVMELASGKTHRLTNYPGDQTAQDGFPTWVSATEVGFTSNTGGADQVYVLPASAVESSGGLKLPTATQPWFGGTSGV